MTVFRPSLNETHVVVWGLGYIGLTTAMELLRLGVRVTGIDVDTKRLEALRREPITLHQTIPGFILDFSGYLESQTLALGTSAAALTRERYDYHFVSVPTERNGMADDAILRSVLNGIRARDPGTCVVIESTISPAWLDEDYFVGIRACLAPRRDWFHGPEHTVRRLTRIVAGTDPETMAMGAVILTAFSGGVVESDSVRAVAFTKAFENSLWFLMIAYTNYLAQTCSSIDIVEVLRLARTNWRTPFELYPSFNVGGYCLPISIDYIERVYARNSFDFADHLRALNEATIDLTVAAVAAIHPGRVAVLGLSYRPDLKVHANAAGPKIVQGLRRSGIECVACDPLYNAREIEAVCGVLSAEFPKLLLDVDVVVLCIPHTEFKTADVSSVLSQRRARPLVVFDGTGAWREHALRAGQKLMEYHGLGTPSWNSP